MMASPRPTDSPVPPPETPVVAKPTNPNSGGHSTLGTSNFIVGFDWLLCVGVLALAFLAVSFSVRNADFWQHLAAGRLLAEGGYSFGKDPFSYVDADRTWVNFAWLFDLVTYLIYKSGGGAGLVIAKGVLVVASAGLLLAARRTNQPIWGGIIVVSLALLGSAPRLMLQPTLVSLFFLSLLLYLLIRSPGFFRGVRVYIQLAAIFWFWVNSDQWFFLGPLLVGLWTLGLYVFPSDETDKTQRRDLLIGLGVGLLICNINPHHVRVWSFPPELVSSELGAILSGDPEYAGLFRGAFAKGALNFTGDERENPINLYSLMILIFLGVLGFLGNYRRFSVSHLLVWSVFLGLGLYRLRLMPFFAFVAAPLTAVHLTEFIQKLVERPMAEGVVRIMATGRLMTRGVMGLIGVGLLIASYPGWLHPEVLQRRWKWDLEPSQSMKLAAENLQQLRTDGSVPAEAKLLNLQPDFACYVAWYAPAEKTFFDYRIGYHAPEATEFLALRKHVNPYLESKEKSAFNLTEFLNKYNITHCVSAPTNALANQNILNVLWQTNNVFQEPPFAIWSVHGRAVTFGRTGTSVISPEKFAALRLDPVKLAFTQLSPPAAPKLEIPLVDRKIEDRFLAPPALSPAEAEEALVLMRYRANLLNQFSSRHQDTMFRLQLGLHQVSLIAGPHPFIRVFGNVLGQYPITVPKEVSATGIVAIRSARRAILSSPDHPDGYSMLALAYPDGNLTVAPELSQIISGISLARAMQRLPIDPTQRRSTLSVAELALSLRTSHLEQKPQRLDLAYMTNRLAAESLRSELDELEKRLSDDNQQEFDARRRKLDRVEKELSTLEQQVKLRSDKFTNESARLTDPLERATLARREGLHYEALIELDKANDRFQKKLVELDANPGKSKLTDAEYGTQLALAGDFIELLLYAGQVEKAVAVLNSIDGEAGSLTNLSNGVLEAFLKSRFGAARIFNPQNPQFSAYDRDPSARFRSLRFVIGLVTGDYEMAITAQKQETQRSRDTLKNYIKEIYPKGLPASIEVPPSGDFDLIIRLFTNPVDPFGAVLGWQSRDSHAKMLINYQFLVRNQSDAHAQLGLTYLEMGDIKAARGQFEEVLKGPALPTAIPSRSLAKDMLKLLGE